MNTAALLFSFLVIKQLEKGNQEKMATLRYIYQNVYYVFSFEDVIGGTVMTTLV